MRHIKTKMLLFLISAVLISSIAANLVTITILRSLYLEELYTSSENTARQILQTTDMTVNTVESSLSVILNSRSINSLLTQTDFRDNGGAVHTAYQDLDSTMNQFTLQFRQFKGFVYNSGSGGMYRYRYYNRSMMDHMQNHAITEASARSMGDGNFIWDGVYKVGNTLDITDNAGEAHVVSKMVVNPANMKFAGTAVAFLDPNLFTATYTEVEEKSGGRVLLLNEKERPIAGHLSDDLMLIADARSRLKAEPGGVMQFVTGDLQMLITAIRSDITGWVLIFAMPLDVLTEKINDSLAWGIGIGAVIIAVTILLIYRYVSALSGSIRTVSDAMALVGKDDFAQRLHTSAKDEIGQIYSGFNAMSENLDRLFHRAVEEERNKREAEIRALYYQIKPHFLYNTLASIRMYAMMGGQEEIARMLATLNRLLRNTINIEDHLITVEDELATLQDYIEINRLRYNNRIGISLRAGEDCLAAQIPNMIIQPVVENAIEHGFAPYLGDPERACAVTVTVSREGEAIRIAVEDNGVGMTEIVRRRLLTRDRGDSRDGHIGLINIHERLRSLYGPDYGVTIESAKGEYTRVVLTVPPGSPAGSREDQAALPPGRKEEENAADTDRG